MPLKILLTSMLIFTSKCLCARILAVIPTPSFSHQVAFRLVWRELSLRGHQVTLLTTDPMNDEKLTNLTEINLHFAYELWNEKYNVTKIINISRTNKIEFAKRYRELSRGISEAVLQHSKVRPLIKNQGNQRFDLVITEFFHPSMQAFSEVYKCPHIVVSSMETITTMYHALGNPAHPILNPDITVPFVPPLNFKERVLSTLYSWFLQLYMRVVVLPQETELINRHFGEQFPPIEEIRNKMSLFLINTNPIFNDIKPLTPGIIQIGGGSHITSHQPLSEKLQHLLDNEPNGVIYFSLGTNVKIGNLDKQNLDAIIEAFEELPYKVIWRFDADDLANKTSKIIVSRWFPQQAILEHPNVKLFITQGGWQSIEESIHSHTPMIGIPFYTDQPNNVKRLVQKGIGLYLDHTTITKNSFKNAIIEIMSNPEYRVKITKLAELVRDQPFAGLEKAVWWIEYVLRHKGAKHLKSPAKNLPLYQHLLLDVFGFFILILASLFSLLKLIINSLSYLKSGFKSKRK